MDFVEKWREEINTSLAKSAALAADINEVDMEYALMATGALWPLRRPVQEFDMEAIEAVNNLVGSQAKHVLKVVQGWDDDMMAAARHLNTQIAANSELDSALNVIIKHFKAFFIFTEELSKHPKSEPPAGRSVTDGSPHPDTGLAIDQPPEPAQPPRVFVSYARSDGEDLARSIREGLEKEGLSVWQDRVKMQGGRDWWLQIVEALNQVEFMALVMTPAAMQSKIVRKEWRYARQQGVCVYPVKGAPDLQFDDLPRWMRNVHFYDPDEEWHKLVTDLSNPCETPRVPFMVEELPDDFVSRADHLNQLSSLLIAENGDPIPATIALHGTGGYGKTMLAKAMCHDDNIRQAFDDGILWVTLGESPGDLTEYVIDLVEVLSGERPGFAGIDAAETRLVQLLADRDILMVIDDVWNVAHLKPFIRGGARCARIITTRNIAAVPDKTNIVDVAAMSQNESVTLLSMELPQGSQQPFHDLAERLSYWPLLLRLTNGALRDRVHNNKQSLPDALAYVNKALDKRGLTAFDAHNAADRDQAVSQTLGVSQDLLTDSERQRYGELAIFPAEVNIPLTVLQKLWGATGGLDDFDTEELCNRLYKLSLLAHFEPNEHYITLQNIVRNYLAQEQKSALPELHQKLLTPYLANLPAFANGSPRWAKLSFDETYLWTYLAYHLMGAGRGAELVDTVKDLSYLINKTYLRSTYSVETDLLAARQIAPDDHILTRLHQSVSQASHLLNQAKTVGEITNTLHSRIAQSLVLTNLATTGATDLEKPLITSDHRLPDLPDSSLIRTLAHGIAVVACDISSDGSTIVSMGRDATLKIWDAHTGAERYTLTGHKVIGNVCAISADGSVVASATWDGVVKIWNAHTGTERLSIQAHSASVFGCAISDDAALLVTASKDKTLKVWDANTGRERFTLEGHERSVTGCAVSADGNTIISCSPDGTVKLWDARTGHLQHTIKSYEETESHNPAAQLTFTAASSALLSCDISADGRVAVSVLPDGALKVWDVATASERFILQGHKGWVENCAISADGTMIVSVSNDKTIRGWDALTGAEKFILEGHARSVSGCAVCADGGVIVSSSQDKTLKLWDSESGAEQSTQTSYMSAAQVCDVSADGKTVIFDSSGNILKVLDAETAVERLTLRGHKRPITGCVFGRDNTTIITASQDRTLKIWDAQTGLEKLTLHGHMWAVNDCALSADGSTIVSVSEDSTLKVWDAATGAERMTLAGHMRGVKGCTISPDNTFIVSAAADKTLKLWDIQAGKAKFTFTGHEGPVNNCAISPDSTLMASASNDDTLKVWSCQTGEERFTLSGHTSSVLQCAFSPNGQWLLSASKDRTLKLWNVQTGQCISTLRVDGALSGCAWFDDGQRIVAVGARGAYFLKLVL